MLKQISLKQTFRTFKYSLRYLLKNVWLKLVVIGIVCGVSFVLYQRFYFVVWIARCKDILKICSKNNSNLLVLFNNMTINILDSLNFISSGDLLLIIKTSVLITVVAKELYDSTFLFIYFLQRYVVKLRLQIFWSAYHFRSLKPTSGLLCLPLYNIKWNW